MFSILVAAYNAEPYLRDALNCLLRQTCAEWEALCVDDGSTDGTLALLQSYAEQDERIKVFRNAKNQGPAVTRNTAISHAKGDIMLMLDADDWLSDNALEKLQETFSRNPETGCVLFSLVEEYDGSSNPYPMPHRPGSVLSGREAFRLSLDWQLHGVYAVRADLQRRYLYDATSHHFSDDNTTRIHYLHSREVRISDAEYHYRKHAGSISTGITPRRFDYLEANLSMKRQLEEENKMDASLVTGDDILFYERHRWLNYVGAHWWLFLYRGHFTKEENQKIKEQLRETYETFPHGGDFDQRKFGYRWYKNYRTFLLQEWFYMRLRWIVGRR